MKLETKRLILRTPRLSDWKDVVEGIGNKNVSSNQVSLNKKKIKKYQRKGYITEAKIAVNDFAFNKLKLRKLKSPVYADNKASNTVQKKMGYKLEGRLIKDGKSLATGKIHDINLYGLFKEDWKKARPKLIKKLNKKGFSN